MKIYDKRTQCYDDAALRAKGLKMLKWSLNKYITGNKVWSKDFHIIVKNSWQRCTAGSNIVNGKRRYYASVNVADIEHDKNQDGTWKCREYKHIAKDEIIGEFNCEHPDKLLLAVLAHEVSHVIHRAIEREQNVKHSYSIENFDTISHGKSWQEIYRTLRVKFVNHLK